MIGYEAIKREIIANPLPMRETPRNTGNRCDPRSIPASEADPPAESPSSRVPDLLQFHFNDSGNANRLIALYGDDLRYCHALRSG